MQNGSESAKNGTKPTFLNSLRSRLLLLTLVFVTLVGGFIFVPAVSNFRISYLQERILSAQTAALALEEVPNAQISPELERELLESAGIQTVVVMRDNSRQLLLKTTLPFALIGQYDLREASLFQDVMDACDTILRRGAGVVQVVGKSTTDRFSAVEILIWERPLYDAMMDYSLQVIITTLIFSLAAALLVYLSLHFMVARPIQAITDSITNFRNHPEDFASTLAHKNRKDEIGIVERELAIMQGELRKTLNQKTHLANLGGAVSKINHDLRNILSTAQMSSDRLILVKDPTVKKLMPRLERSIGRAVSLCEHTLKYGKTETETPTKQSVDVNKLVKDVCQALGLDNQTQIVFNNTVDDGLSVEADADHLFRCLMNLFKNAVEAIEGQTRDGIKGTLTLSAEEDDEMCHLFVSDTGPGLSAQAKTHLFKPFLASSKTDGTGLGLTIVQELMAAHGGTVMLDTSDENGTTFKLCLPKRGQHGLSK